ncbi:unnamed protein product, partial [Staurois parvus]
MQSLIVVPGGVWSCEGECLSLCCWGKGAVVGLGWGGWCWSVSGSLHWG